MTAPRPSDPNRKRAGDVIVHVFGRTDVGRTREHNEDAFVVADLSTGNATLQPEVRTHVVGELGSLFMVADGMGGAAAGEIASAMAVETILEELRRLWAGASRKDPDTFASALREATVVANGKIHGFATSHPEYRGMGTTATIAGILGDTLYLAQVGDSRAYLVRDGAARQITKDQSLMQKLIEAGEITEEEAEQSERRNIILQALGPEGAIKVDLTSQQVRRGDTLILCSDGLSGQVRKEEIAQIAAQERDLTALCRRLIDRANELGGPDNITVVAARFDGDGLQTAGTADAVGHSVFRLSEESGTPTVPVERFTPRSAAAPPVPAANSAPRPAAADGAGRGMLLVIVLVGALLLLGVAVMAMRRARGERAGLEPAATPPAAVPSLPAAGDSAAAATTPPADTAVPDATARDSAAPPADSVPADTARR
ncbi:MAG TPA: Stp1/IreP family PP2C-type Ser/Thr phosphatase [Gemmatimonadaceae bacterium]|nr:Stp1/IreP family PP2C-type Ser/Thr phosphatase [Gemmatimonadaceae bacterium]